jgi:hypothetical protein
MKHIISLFICILYLNVINAQQSPIMTCDVNNTNCNPYYNLDTAIYYANSGDYIYLPGGTFNLNIPISKELHIYGAGINGDSSTATSSSIVNGSMWFTDTISNSSFEGFILNGSICNFSATPKIINAIFSRMVIGNVNHYYNNSNHCCPIKKAA